MRRVIVVLVLSALLPINSWATGNPTEDKIKEAEKFTRTFNFKKALRLYTEVIEENGSSADLLTKRGLIFLTMHKTAPAIRDFKSAILLEEQHVMAHFGMATYHKEHGDIDSALYYINNAAAFTDDKEQMLEFEGVKGGIHLKKGEYKEALESLESAANHFEVESSVMRDLALTHHKLENHEQASAVLEETLSIFGDEIETLVNVGYIANEIGNYERAISYFDKALEKEPGQPYALSNKAFSLLKMEQTDKALKLVKRSLENDNTNTYAYKVKGDVYAALGENKKACKEYRKAVEMGYVLYYGKEEITQALLDSCGSL